MSKKILIVVGTRPNFIKVTQFKRCAKEYPSLEFKIVHTGQHYDAKMADVFFEQFELVPDYFLNISNTSANTQMAEIMIGLERVCKEYNPQLIIVVGDVNSTFAAALTANKLGLKIAHLESGLRSFDRTMPEEINRILSDEIADYYFVTEQSGTEHLKKEGKQDGQIFFVGNTMIDTMVAFEEKIQSSAIITELQLELGKFVLMTIHRPATVDNVKELEKLLDLLEYLSNAYKVVFPVHPRTINNLKKFELYERFNAITNIIITEPLDYFAFQKLIADCRFILTDSGGIQEESTFRLKPCITLRPNTERPSTVNLGTNTLLPFDIKQIKNTIKSIEDGSYKKGQIPPLWDGKSTERIVKLMDSFPF
ncbi:non-hydrolyzing UDP-N-acetylglucosamine 2-epimerase [Aurantibacillus circumpalustris]|uniref:non-hydrolyzing UDP-N-acetylglucosamine 2-epimerase n=1 Tax=Aurantibacillus circumpalustris TaxID=3036359 RepID=UPI00295AD138|nr:UDP-N-acetylglucosamine 2-epimerase (non-hydrolyzing) [Aurantibacillus circumpalustris]